MIPDGAPRRREAWGHRDDGSPRSDPPHWVDWPHGTYAGRALCGKELVPLRIDPLGTAPMVGVAVCGACVRAAEPIRRFINGGHVVDLAARRAQRGLW